jgi:hypothetical protein
MSLDGTFKNVGDSFTAFWLGSIKRWRAASAKVASGTFNADDLALNLGAAWVDAANLAFSFYPATNALPTVPIEQNVAAGVVDTRGEAFLEDITNVTNLQSSDLVWLGDERTLTAAQVVTIPAANVTVTYDSTTLGKINVAVKYTNAQLVMGTYQGIAYSGSLAVANIVMRLY